MVDSYCSDLFQKGEMFTITSFYTTCTTENKEEEINYEASNIRCRTTGEHLLHRSM